MRHEQLDVLDFHEACDLPAPIEPTLQHAIAKRTRLRIDLMLEEAGEIVEACGGRFRKEGTTYVFDVAPIKRRLTRSQLLSAIDGWCDLIYVTYGWAVELGVNLVDHWDAVHTANMQKTEGPKRADGKQLKPKGWQPPNHDEILPRKL